MNWRWELHHSVLLPHPLPKGCKQELSALWKMVKVGSGWSGDQRPFITVEYCRKRTGWWQWEWRGGHRGEGTRRGVMGPGDEMKRWVKMTCPALGILSFGESVGHPNGSVQDSVET